MKETNEKKQIATMWLLTILIIILIAIIVGLFIKLVQLKKESGMLAQQQFEQTQQTEPIQQNDNKAVTMPKETKTVLNNTIQTQSELISSDGDVYIDEEEHVNNGDENRHTNDELIKMTKAYLKAHEMYIPSMVEISKSEEDKKEVMIHLYDINQDGVVVTSDWYTIDRYTCKGTNILDEVIDLTDTKENKETDDNILNADEVMNKLGKIENDVLDTTYSKNFCISNIENTEDGYIITACLLNEMPRALSKSELQELKEGKEIEFREKKWVIDETNADGSLSIKPIDPVPTNEHTILSINNFSEAITPDTTLYFCNYAGIPAKLADYSGEKIKFKVSKDILICDYWQYFVYDSDGQLHQYNIDQDKSEENNPMKLYSMEEMKSIIKDLCGSYEECRIYVNNGKIDAIKMENK